MKSALNKKLKNFFSSNIYGTSRLGIRAYACLGVHGIIMNTNPCSGKLALVMQNAETTCTRGHMHTHACHASVHKTQTWNV